MHFGTDHSHLQVIDPLLAEPASERADIGVGDVSGDILSRRLIELGQELADGFPAAVFFEAQRVEASEIEQPLSHGVGPDGSVRNPVEHQDFGGEAL